MPMLQRNRIKLTYFYDGLNICNYSVSLGPQMSPTDVGTIQLVMVNLTIDSLILVLVNILFLNTSKCIVLDSY